MQKLKFSEVKELFSKTHKQEAAILQQGKTHKWYNEAACVWLGFKSALETIQVME